MGPRSTASLPGVDEARAILRHAGASSRTERGERAEALAGALLQLTRALTTPEERDRQGRLGRLVDDPPGQALTTALTDRVFRSREPRRVVEQLRKLCARLGVPRSMDGLSRLQLGTAARLGQLVPALTSRAVLSKARDEARSVLLQAEPAALAAFLAKRHREGVRVNLNQLGEALLGEREAGLRVAKYAQLAEGGGCDALSVKVSSIGSQLNLLAFDHTAATLAARLAGIYRASLQQPAETRPIVMLDMEAYADLWLTFEVMKRALADRTLAEVRAGIVLQAYLPDSHALLQEVVRLSEARVAGGGAPLRIRLVKGANLAHERVESAKAGLALPIYGAKTDVDASYKRLLEQALPHVRSGVLQLGVASHNLFDLAYALLMRSELASPEGLGIEMLEGMANDTVRALRALDVDVLVYAPVCSDDAMNTGIAYLVRRLDENTAPENFLRVSFAMQPGDASFVRERERFRASLARIDGLDLRPRRELASYVPGDTTQFRGEPDSDFTQASVRAALREALWQGQQREATTVRSQVAGELLPIRERRAGRDPSHPDRVPYHVALAGADDVERALACAAADPRGWSQTTAGERIALLGKVAETLRAARGALIASLVMDGGKRVVEADAEVSEAIDFAMYYRTSYQQWLADPALSLTPRGAVLVTPPWNFPLAIPAGGVLAALVTGNRVLLKPALETAYIGSLLASLLWQAGIPREALQLLVCDDAVASKLVEDARIDTTILTGATDTARLFQRLRPGLRLLAETGGKNAYVVSAMSDRELAIRDVVQSAFGHAGQKCSACSLLILEAEVHDDPHFMATLEDAVRSLHVGSAWDERSFVTPLIQPPGGTLQRALSTLEQGERWLVEPRVDPHNPGLVSPSVRVGVAPGSFTHTTELFGPTLSVLRADSLTHAIALANMSGYGLTAGLASLDEDEQTRFADEVRAGNVYINRTITGAIVQRQPFGGVGKSGFGPGAKAGGPNYVLQLCRVASAREMVSNTLSTPLPATLHEPLRWFSELLPPHEVDKLQRTLAAFAQVHTQHFQPSHDFVRVLGQDNLFRYRPAHDVVLRVERDAAPYDVALSCLAARLAGCALLVSLAPEFEALGEQPRTGHAQARETLAELRAHVPAAARIRLLGRRSADHDLLSSALGAHLADEAVLASARVELLHYLEEQSVSVDYHRYGNLGARAQP